MVKDVVKEKHDISVIEDAEGVNCVTVLYVVRLSMAAGRVKKTTPMLILMKSTQFMNEQVEMMRKVCIVRC